MGLSAEAWATVAATVISPIAAFVLSIWYQERKQKQEAKIRLFTTAIMHRKGMPPKVEWVNALNLIDVVFQDAPKVTEAWHSLYDYFHIKPLDPKLLEQKVNDLLFEMALNLGYGALRQTNLDKFYFPEGHSNMNSIHLETQIELLRVLKATKTLNIEPVDPLEQATATDPEKKQSG